MSSPTPDWAAKVEWLEAQGARRREDAAARAAGLPDDGEALARLTWLRGRGYPVDGDAVLAAARSGNTAALQYLLAEGPIGGADYMEACQAAFSGGHLASLQALHAAGMLKRPRRYNCAASAARGGHLHVLVWLLEAQLLELHEDVFNAAVRSGSVEVLAWLRQHGCPWDSHAYLGAVAAGCETVLEWLVEQGCPMEDSGQPYLEACRNGDLATARCLRRLGVPWGPAGRVVYVAATQSRAPLPLLRWMLEEGCSIDFEATCKGLEQWRSDRPHWVGQVLQLLQEHMDRRQR
ncbi:hypothetical protein GPECTOR_23g160 [Gonium pectorale]|uniref:Ankyrin repeat domain-containing protein n=1 Tax=Gonium pectorale TaxID=33097 RepID=A0A150GGW4_GONPE|nr:hypothetical protein GPECTOR_23g160 [Gonium pectorale]|eukprot:KXZ49076.1 hypothetical protein GPECTOR_23g160 [Gonium pectorale]